MEKFEEYCLQFPRIFSKEIIQMPENKGAVILFSGSSSDDREETLAELNLFLEKDPLILEGIVEKWDILDMNTPQALIDSLKSASTDVPLPEDFNIRHARREDNDEEEDDDELEAKYPEREWVDLINDDDD